MTIANLLNARTGAAQPKLLQDGKTPLASRPACLTTQSVGLPDDRGCSLVKLADASRLVVMITPHNRGTFGEQAAEVLSALHAILHEQSLRMSVTVQTVFLRNATDDAECRRLLKGHFGSKLPVTNIVFQPPACGAALAIEAWAIGGKSVRIERYGSHALSVEHDGLRWIYCSVDVPENGGVYDQARDGLQRTVAILAEANSSIEHVVRTWFYLGGITNGEPGVQGYQEMNRARAEFYRDIRFCRSLVRSPVPRSAYPASTGIGMQGSRLVVGCVAVETDRSDVFLLPLENPRQTPAYAYQPEYSPHSPKFSRGMALIQGDCVTTWISGTASIVSSESCHPGDIERQTAQTIDNIERLIGSENATRHGLNGAGATLRDLAKVRVYLKRPEDLAKCRAVCERRLGSVPALYLVADVCRPELLVEIEGVAFSACSPPDAPAS
jgi:enamine deaminase RidA (YjgF/YER057c/UK114 family)